MQWWALAFLFRLWLGIPHSRGRLPSPWKLENGIVGWLKWKQGHTKISEDDLKTLRCSCAVRAIMFLLDATPDTKDQCRDTWQAILSLIDKILGTNWFTASPKAFQKELVSVKSMFVLGVEMHHSNQDQQGKAEAYKKTLQTSSSKSSLYSQSC